MSRQFFIRFSDQGVAAKPFVFEIGDRAGRAADETKMALQRNEREPTMSKITLKRGIAFGLTLLTSALLLGCHGGVTCADGASKNPDTGVCLKVSGDYKLEDKASKAGDASSLAVRHAKTFHSFTIWIEKPADLAARAKVVAGMETSDLKLVASGDTAPNPGKFFHFHNAAGNYDFAIALVPGKEHFYRCEIQNAAPEEATEMLEQCKTVGGP